MTQGYETSGSLSSSRDDEKESFSGKEQYGYPTPLKSPTEANALPDVADEPQGRDVERLPSQKPGGGGPPPGGMHDPSSFPDGGFKAWLCVVGGFLCLFCSFGWINAIGVFQEYYQTDLLSNYSASTISWIVSLETFFMFFGGPIVGKLYDNFGPRWVLLGGSLLHIFGLMMTSVSTEYYQVLLAQGICSPIGASAVFYPAMSAVVTWFHKRRALALGIMASGSSLGGVIFPILVQNLIPKIGFPWTMRVCGFIILGLLTISNLTVRSRLPPSPRPFSITDFVKPLREPAFVALSLGAFFIFLGLFIPFNFITLSAISLGMSVNLSNYLLSILNAASIFGRILPGWAADKLGRFNVQIIMCAVCFVVDLALWLPSRGDAPIIIFAILYGFASGAFVSVTPAIIAQISDIRQIGTRSGTLFALISFAALVGNPIGGALLSEDDGSYWGLQVFAGVTVAVGSGMLVVSKALIPGQFLKKF